MLLMRVQYGIVRFGVHVESRVGKRFCPGLSPGLFYAPAEDHSVRVRPSRSFLPLQKSWRYRRTGRVVTSPASRQPPAQGGGVSQSETGVCWKPQQFPGNAAVVDLPFRHASRSTSHAAADCAKVSKRLALKCVSEPNSSSR